MGLINRIKRPIFLVHDGARYHTSKMVENFINENSHRIKVLQLPKHSPDYNPIEKLWKQMKKEGTHNKYFAEHEQMVDAVNQVTVFFENQPKKVLSLCKMFNRINQE